MEAGFGTLAGGRTNPSPARWAGLPDDLLAMVRIRVASIRDRVRLSAVCKPWHAAVSRFPMLPSAPLLLLSPHGRSEKKHLCGPDGSWVLRVPSKARNKRFVGAHQGGWIAATDESVLVIVNLFSGAEVVLSAKQSTRIACNPSRPYLQNSLHKIIFSEHPDSSNGCTVAGLRGDRFTIVLCKIGCRLDDWSEQGWYEEWISDIAFCNGDLYGLAGYSEMLVKFEIGTRGDGTPVVTAIQKIAIQRRDGPWIYDIMRSGYILELNGELSMAVRNRWLPNSEPFFRVFKLADAGDKEPYKHKWKVASLGDCALFLGPQFSKAVHVPVGACGGMERNHIYYSDYFWLNEYEFRGNVVYSVTTDDGDRAYCRKDQRIDNGVEMTGYYTMRTYNSSMWIYPPDL